jgi:hypothetical protein
MELAPDFRCPKCGASVGAQRKDGGPWEPQERCHRCEQKLLAKDAAARRKLGHVAAGVDLDKAFAAYRKIPPFVGNLGHIKLSVGHRTEARWSGHAATYRRSLRVAYGPSATKAEVLEVLMHEMVHLACPRREHHGERFKLTLRRAARELWGIEVPMVQGKDRGDEHNAAYAMDRLIMTALEGLVAEGKVETFPYEPKPKKPKVPSGALVERRAAHAVKMLTRSEKRAQAAQRTLSKWRQKVRYYERQAAKRGAAP